MTGGEACAAASASAAGAGPGETATAGEVRMRRILIVEDEPDIRELIAICIELAGWEPIEASGADEALRRCLGTPPDAILLDVMMPGIDGPATLAGLRARDDTSAIPVVFITAKTDAATRKALEGLGAAGVIEKPFETGSLTCLISTMVGWPSSR